jgi:outer membrane receptor protein involved in Fe transport
MIQDELMSGNQFGGDWGDRYPGYDFNTRFNGSGTVMVRSLDLSYNQNLGVIAPGLRPLAIRLGYTRAYAEVIKSGLIPHALHSGLNFNHRGLSLYANCNWTDDFPTSASGMSLRRHRSQTDLGGSLTLSRTYSLSFSVRNIFNDKYIHMQQVPPSARTLQDCLEVGATYSLSLRGQW